jgi:rubrerythrin
MGRIRPERIVEARARDCTHSPGERSIFVVRAASACTPSNRAQEGTVARLAMHPPSSLWIPTPITRHEIFAELNDLLARELDAVAAYRAAIQRMGDMSLAAQLAAFEKDHEGHLRDLGAAVERLGGRPCASIDDRPIPRGGCAAAEPSGDDRRILETVCRSETDTLRRYDGAMRRCGAASPTIKDMLARHLLDERRQRAWLDRRLQTSVPA